MNHADYVECLARYWFILIVDFLAITDDTQMCMHLLLLVIVWRIKPGFYYPSSRVVNSARELRPWTRVVETGLKREGYQNCSVLYRVLWAVLTVEQLWLLRRSFVCVCVCVC